MKFDNRILRCLGIVQMFYTIRLLFRFVYLQFLELDYKTCAVMPLERHWKYEKLKKWRKLVWIQN